MRYVFYAGSRNYFMRRLLLLFFILSVGVFAAVGQTPSPTPTPNDGQVVLPDDLKGVPDVAPNYKSHDMALPDLGRVGVDVTKERPLTLAEALRMALENNKDIEVARKTSSMAEFDLKASRGVFEPRLAGQTYYERATSPNVSIFSNNPKTTQGTVVANAGLTGFIPKFGTILSGTFNNSRVTTDNPISILSPQYLSSLNFSVTQPLLRGFRFDAQRRGIEIAKRNVELTDTQFLSRTIDTVSTVEKAYWDLIFALRNLQVQRDGVRIAKAQLEHNKRLVNEGQLAPIDIVAAETQVANFEQAVYDALNAVNINENMLKNLIAPTRTDAIWGEAIVPVESVEQTAPTTTLTDAIDSALANRPELAVNNAQLAINKVDQRYYSELRKPQLDLVASYGTAGVGGSQNPHFSTSFPTACNVDPTGPACAQQQANLALLTGNPFRGIFTNRYPTYRVGLNFNIPIFGDKTNGALLGKAKVDAERLETQREQLEQGIQVEVRNAMQAVRSGEARLRAAAISRENSEKQYASEQRKLDEGQSDIYRVLERQTALIAAKSVELKARTDLNKAIVDLQRATGNSLKANNITPSK
ncbi:MAG: TolC family protein [Acidobacteria bacterium]|nr:TolC family protein [Acidobacteriota bacterium]